MPHTETIRPVAALTGTVVCPPDKSVAHRAALLAALAEGTSVLHNYAPAADPQSTLACIRQLGISWAKQRDGTIRVEGQGLQGLRRSDTPLDCGNSGTTMRLLAGILAGQTFDSTLIGDASLSTRPMGRIADPLQKMGATLHLTEGHAPIHLAGKAQLEGITYPLPIPSAQIKSCVLLAGLFAAGETVVIETTPSRDHTERMLGLPITVHNEQRHIRVPQGHTIAAQTWVVPGDFSSAAFFLVAGSIVPEGELLIQNVGLNPSRTALLGVLRDMGADIALENPRTEGGEPLANLRVRPARLHAPSIAEALIPNLIDELPILAVAAACAEGRTEIRHAAELRVKETDRIAAMVTNLRALGVAVEEYPDGLAITGGAALRGNTVDSFGDHRIAMAMGIAGLVATDSTTIQNAEAAAVSYRGFWEDLARLSA